MKNYTQIIAIIMVLVSLYHIYNNYTVDEESQPTISPLMNSAESVVVAEGVIRSYTDDINLSPPFPSVVVEMYKSDADIGTKIVKGDRLYRVDDRLILAELKTAEANYDYAKSQLIKLESMPRPEEVEPLVKAVDYKKAVVDRSLDRLSRLSKLLENKSVNESEYLNAKYDTQMAKADYEKSLAELELIKSGAWEADILIAKSEAAKALSNMERLKLELDRCIIKSPIDGTLLDIEISEGEFVSPEDETMIVGKNDILYIEASFDEQFITDFDYNNKAVMVTKGGSIKYDLHYVRTIPRAIPKTNLNGLSNELVDSRVIKIIYEIINPHDLIVGQQVEVQVLR